ncbi:homogentisate 1,2-dioxygenase [Egicoccus halophilus]|uniref:homogentisate 1,2-dioxygenase n=1 Tax=Egicoccus halophilus TaxID=1670830 RepID=UPI00351A2E1E
MSYQRFGDVPAKRHTQLWRDGRLLTEEVIGLDGFDGPASTLYHLHQPMQLRRLGGWRPLPREEWVPEAHIHHHFAGQTLAPGGDALSGRRLLAFNDDVEVWLARPDRVMSGWYRNGEADELLFVHEGCGTIESVLGDIDYRDGDYVVLPRGITYRVVPDGPTPQRHLVVVSSGLIEVPSRYRNGYGQLLEHAPFCQRDLRGPSTLRTIDQEGEFEVTLRIRGGLQDYVVPHHPCDVVGWDGYLAPWALNIADLEPLTKQIHPPPPVHQTFEGRGFTVCTFLPRPLDWHPQAVPIPYSHANLNSEELIYYVAGSFGSRRGIDVASLTLHPSGLTHGPQPGLAEGSLGTTHTEEVAVMVDTFHPLRLTSFARELDQPDYAWSWTPPIELEPASEPAVPRAAGASAAPTPTG